MNRITKVSIKGFKTFKDAELEPGNLNVMIGPNGAGKSNLISYFRMLNWMLGSTGQLQLHVAQEGGASKILHNGSQITTRIEGSLSIETENGDNDYKFVLAYSSSDTFIFVEEKYRFSKSYYNDPYPWNEIGAGHKESNLIATADTEGIAKYILSLLRECRVFQFHNTSKTARIKEKWKLSDCKYLKEDAANLGVFLHALLQDYPACYRKIVETIRLVLPFFDDFVLEPEHGHILLSWREKGSDIVFDASQASDGMLRILSLVSLLGQPEENLPEILILDEPELGLHPYAISVIADMIKSASKKVQIFVATQSVTLVDQFDPEDVIVVERHDGETEFCRFKTEDLKEWIGEYSLGDLWLMNRIGGRP